MSKQESDAEESASAILGALATDETKRDSTSVQRSVPEDWKEQGPYRVWTSISTPPGKDGPAAFAIIMRNAIGQEKLLVGWRMQISSHEIDLHAVITALEEVPCGAAIHITTPSQVSADGFNKWLRWWQLQDWRNSAGRPITHPLLWQRIVNLANDRAVVVERCAKKRPKEARRALAIAQAHMASVAC